MGMKCLILHLALIIFLIGSNDSEYIVISESSDVCLSCGRRINKVGPPDSKLYSELNLLKSFIIHNTEGISSLPRVCDAS